MRLVECVPNFSEGRREAIVQGIASTIRTVAEVRLLDVAMDPDHNRTVMTLAGPPDAAGEAAVRATAEAARVIDLGEHRGAHPRIGATDVIPFVPLSGVTMDDCVSLARAVGRRIGLELGIPVYLYGAAAVKPDRVQLTSVRRGEYEMLKEAIERDPGRRPDFGPPSIGPAGATAVGARKPLVAYNVELATTNVDIAKEIAGRIRESSGGLAAVQALGFALPGRNTVQVSMNLLDYRRTSPHIVLNAIRQEAARLGVAVAGAELIGLAPADLLAVVARDTLAITEDAPLDVLESRIVAEW